MSDAEDFVHNWQYKTLEFDNLFLCRNWALTLTCMLWCLENQFWMMRSVFLLLSSACKNSQYLYLWLTYLSPCLERTDGNFSLQVCFWLWSDSYFFKPCVSCLYMCFSSGQCHLLEVMQQQARTFLWWFYSSLRPLLVQCHQVALLLQIRLPHGSKVYEILSSTIVCTMDFGTSQLQDLVLGKFCFDHFFYNLWFDIMLKQK